MLISFVSPFYNEEGCIAEYYQRVKDTAAILNADFELICVDDGSTDNTLNILKSLHEQDSSLKVISLSRNFGHQIALIAGLHHVSGDCAIVLDGDLQDPPEIALDMVEKWRQGYQVVYAIREKRKEGVFKRICYKTFYRILGKLSKINIPMDSGDFCLMDKIIVEHIKKFNEINPFVRGLRSWIGFRQTGQRYERSVRNAGKSKYSYYKLFQLAFHGLTSFSDALLNLSGITGIFLALSSLLYGFLISVNRILIFFGYMSSERLIPGWTTIVALLTLVIGMQFIFMGIIGKYIGYIFMQSKQRPLYIVKETYGI